MPFLFFFFCVIFSSLLYPRIPAIFRYFLRSIAKTIRIYVYQTHTSSKSEFSRWISMVIPRMRVYLLCWFAYAFAFSSILLQLCIYCKIVIIVTRILEDLFSFFAFFSSFSFHSSSSLSLLLLLSLSHFQLWISNCMADGDRPKNTPYTFIHLPMKNFTITSITRNTHTHTHILLFGAACARYSNTPFRMCLCII